MKALDILWLLLLLWGAYSGFTRGFVVDVCSFGVYLIVIICAKLLQQTEREAHYLLFILACIVIVLIVTLIGRLGSHLIHMTFFKGIDKLLGALLGIFKWLVVIVICLWLANVLQFNIPHSYLADTYFLPLIQSINPGTCSSCSSLFKLVIYLFLNTYKIG